MTKQAILCVDDEAIIVMAMKEEIKRHFKGRFVYEMACSASDGIRIVDQLSGEGIRLILVISDWLMPGMKGDEILSEVRRRHPEAKTIMITGQATPDALERMKNDGLANSIILKPWQSKDLIGKIEALVGE